MKRFPPFRFALYIIWSRLMASPIPIAKNRLYCPGVSVKFTRSPAASYQRAVNT